MAGVLVDSNVLLDILTEDPIWFNWSAEKLAAMAESFVLMINPIIYSEVSVGFKNIEELERCLPADAFVRQSLPWEAAFLAGKCYVAYRRSGGVRRSPLPDFYIGAHAAVAGLTLLTRDVSRYQTYFPTLKLIAP
ncbi:type II toxin-antitoxin system VapC family toxin [Pelovirga terrestris]|uniref:Type II toxin-antitoxin system VapC family toxin n=1 Tax=Pelovirga terrestris TaxID=2771352 RepID=A0A8J6QNI5_9BACT|nr:type II toxin-antitoxin system VapC family toxin [Pelovirga terrestris]MBD1400897.1 type II toxin-antitoxin system VapC family toxin [Pelovirga terrestris]